MTQGSLFDAEPPSHVKPSEDHVRTLRVLITVKAAPNPSSAHGETVCVAGLSLDLECPGWRRLYPINFRHLEQDVRFHKYDVVAVDAVPARNDVRVESWRPHMATLRVEGHLRPWRRRREWLDPVVEMSMCELNAAARDQAAAKSLALVRVADVAGLEIDRHPGWTPDEQAKIDAYVNQLTLSGDDDRTPLEAPRFRGYYRWRCYDSACNGHRQGLLDWEFVALQRRLGERNEAETRRALVTKFVDQICNPSSRDVAFYVGNQAKRHHVFSVLGAYYPSR